MTMQTKVIKITDPQASAAELGEAARVLKAAGAAEVLCLTLSMVRD